MLYYVFLVGVVAAACFRGNSWQGALAFFGLILLTGILALLAQLIVFGEMRDIEGYLATRSKIPTVSVGDETTKTLLQFGAPFNAIIHSVIASVAFKYFSFFQPIFLSIFFVACSGTTFFRYMASRSTSLPQSRVAAYAALCIYLVGFFALN